MGSPMVFQTAPPHPASKARITWPPVLVGGPEASQKGLGERRPQKLTDRSDINYLPLHCCAARRRSHRARLARLLRIAFPASRLRELRLRFGCRARVRRAFRIDNSSRGLRI